MHRAFIADMTLPLLGESIAEAIRQRALPERRPNSPRLPGTDVVQCRMQPTGL